jgi:hypothetical protein
MYPELYIKGTGNFRESISVSRVYKGQRKQPKPVHYDALREYAKSIHHAVEVDGMEVDDLVSVELWANRAKDSGVILVAIDKDLWNTPGWHYNYHPKRLTTEYVTTKEADRNFLKQVLTGDAVDNIPGIPGIGERKAEAILVDLDTKEAMRAVWEAYRTYGCTQGWDDEGTRTYLLEQGRLLWMTRRLHPDGSPVLWDIPKFIWN